MLDKNSNVECFILNFRVMASISQKEDKMSARKGKKGTRKINKKSGIISDKVYLVYS